MPAAIFRFVFLTNVPFKDKVEDCRGQCILLFTGIILAMTSLFIYLINKCSISYSVLPSKKIFIPLLLIVVFFSTARAQYVTIPDTNFVNWLDTSGYAACMNGNQMDTTCGAILNAQALYCNAVPIRDLTGVQYFKSLYFLNCASDSLSTLPNLPVTLGFLTCQNNKLGSLPALPGGLTNLICSFNHLTALPALPGPLITFSCNNNQLTSLPALPPSLEDLSCGYNQLTSLPALSSSLKSLNCQNNPALACLPQLHNLSYLNFDSTAINCLPNYFQVNSSVPPLDTIPLCDSTGSGCPSFTGIAAVSEKLNLLIYPNPARNNVVIETAAQAVGGILDISDLTGREIVRLQITNSAFQIPTFALTGGVYFVRVSDTHNCSSVAKLVIE